jgi:hypothetical protein
MEAELFVLSQNETTCIVAPRHLHMGVTARAITAAAGGGVLLTVVWAHSQIDVPCRPSIVLAARVGRAVAAHGYETSNPGGDLAQSFADDVRARRGDLSNTRGVPSRRTAQSPAGQRSAAIR